MFPVYGQPAWHAVNMEKRGTTYIHNIQTAVHRYSKDIVETRRTRSSVDGKPMNIFERIGQDNVSESVALNRSTAFGPADFTRLWRRSEVRSLVTGRRFQAVVAATSTTTTML